MLNFVLSLFQIDNNRILVQYRVVRFDGLNQIVVVHMHVLRTRSMQMDQRAAYVVVNKVNSSRDILVFDCVKTVETVLNFCFGNFCGEIPHAQRQQPTLSLISYYLFLLSR